MAELTLFNAETKEQIIELLKMGENINKRYNGYNALQEACSLGKIEIVKALYEHGLENIPIIQWNNDHRIISPIGLAAKNGFLNIIKYLIEQGHDYQYIMHYAVVNGFMDIIDYGIELGININTLDYTGRTILNIACRYKHHDIVNKILTLTNVIVNNDDLLEACYFANDIKNNNNIRTNIITQLYIRGVDIDYQNKCMLAPLHILSQNFNAIKSVKFLISVGCNINIQNKKGSTPLHLACYKYNYKMIKILIKNGANTTIKNNDGFTPLYYAKTQEIKDLFKKD